MRTQTTTVEEFETVEEYVKTLREKDFMHVICQDRNGTFDKLNLGIEFGRVKFRNEHYLVIFEDCKKEIRGPFRDGYGVNGEASAFATETAAKILEQWYEKITVEQFCSVGALKIFMITDLWGQSYIAKKYFFDL